MSNKKKTEINFDRIDKQVHKAVLADEKYSRENDAKFRALHQKVATYDEFKGIVEASHLKPLDKTDKITTSGTFQQVWNSQASSKDGDDLETNPLNLNLVNIPKNSSDFWKEWRNIKISEEKTNYLLKFKDSQIRQFFKMEIPSDQLESLIKSLSSVGELNRLSTIIECIQNSKRFNLAVSFMSLELKRTLQELTMKLESINPDLVTSMMKILSL
ncbi:DgyrCDS4711 [Dimorphilus gyrociliatus]|uniref:DgyrCDS4711 n=1 Tax=Dimorphilus gyrociliatus TaxID=2664684 RepID=A0A7I8VJ84_9ANNE|nr:DgyrCDS4711 [Dimorphilus gyrociliatus]